MAYLSLPDGSYYEIPKGMNAQQAFLEAYKKYPQAFGAQAEAATKPKEPGILESGIGGAKKLLSSQRTALESFINPEEAAQAGVKRSRELEEKTPSQLSLEKVKEKYAKEGFFPAAGEVLRQAPSFVAEQLPQLGESLATARLGAMAGAPGGLPGVIAGGIAGGILPLALQAYGAGAERRSAEGLPQDPGKTALSAAGQASLEYASMAIPLGGKIMSRLLNIPEKEAAQALLSPAARKLAEERLATSIAKGTTKGLLAEIPTEVGQQMLERWQANMPLMDNNAIKEYTEAAYGAALFGGPFGGVGRRAEVGLAKEDVTRADALEAAKKAKELRETEAARKASPEYILDIADRHDAAKAQLAETQQRLKEAKPGKDATEGQQDIYAGLQRQYKEQIEAFKPLKKDYDEVKGEARALRTSQLPVRPEAPVVQGNVQQMMDQHREAQTALAPLETQMQEAAAKGDTATINTLLPQYQQQQVQLQQLGAQIEQLGGTTKAPEIFESEAAKEQKALEKQIKAAQKKLVDTAELGDFEALPSLAAKLDELKAQQAEQQAKTEQQREALRVNAVPVGETLPMFPGEAAPQATEVIKPAEAAAGPLPQEKETRAGITLDLFSDFNLLNTAIQNRDERTIANMQRAREEADKKALAAAASKMSPREEVYEALKDKIGNIIRRERNYDVYEATINGERQEVYLSDAVAKEISELRRKVEEPIGNAKRSMLQIAHDNYAVYEARLAKLEEAQAANVAAVKITTLQNQVNTALRKYEGSVNRIKPYRDALDAAMAKLYKTTEVATPRQKAAETAALGKSAREMSREAKQTKKVEEGKVSASAARVARELGFETEEYQKLATTAQKKVDARVKAHNTFIEKTNKALAALKKQVGDTSDLYKEKEAAAIKEANKRIAALKEFKDSVAADLNAKAEAIGKTLPEYRSKKLEETKEFKKAVATGKQEVKSKRTTQATRKLPKLSTMTTGSAESQAASTARQEGFRRKMTGEERKKTEQDFREGADDAGLAFRTAKAPATPVDPAEAKKLIVETLSTLPKGVKLVYVPTLEGMDPALLKRLVEHGYKEGEAFKGVVLPDDGTIVVVGDQHTSVTDLEETLFHEMVGHYGIDTVIGMERLQKYANDTDVIALAEKLGGEPLVREAVAAAKFAAEQGKSEEVQKLQALREVIAYTAQKRITESFREKADRWLKEFVGMVRSALRRMGFKNMARMSTSDVFYAIKLANKAFNDRTVGPYRAEGGVMAFRTKREPSRYGQAFVGGQKGIIDDLRGNMLGLSGRVQFVDQYAALDAAIKKGLDAGVISDLEAEQAGYYLRFGQQANAYATQAITNGPLSLVRDKRGAGFVYKSTPGASLAKYAEALQKSGIKNSTELEEMATIYEAGPRAKQVGWDKLDFANPAAAEAAYNKLMAELNDNPKAKAAFEEASKIYKEYNNGLVDFLVQTGYMKPSLAAQLKAVSYVPFYRAEKDGTLNLWVDKERPIRIANIKDEPILHELVGGNKAILPIFTSSAQNAFLLTRMALRNQMVKDNAMLLARLGIASKIGKGRGPDGSNTIRFKVKGEDHFAVIDSEMYGIPADLIVKGMEGIKTTVPLAIKFMGIPANILRKFVTRNPTYALRQPIRDSVTAWLTTGTDGVPVLNSMTEIARAVAGRSKEATELMQAGVISSNVMTGDMEDMSRALRDVSLGKSGWAKWMMRADALAMQGDAATRAVIYKDSLAKGMSEMQAYMRTLESMNFSRRGLSPSIQMLSTVIPFFNAQIQGLDVLYRAFKGQMPYNDQLKIRQKLYTRGLLLAAGTLAYAAAMEDDEAYKRAKPEERLGNWFVYTPFSDEPMRVPIPFELGYLFKALPEAVYNTAAEDERNQDIIKGMSKLLAQSNPFALPAAIKPATEVILGRSFFGGDIESKREQTTSMPGERYREGTTEIAKMLGRITGDAGLTPIKIDYLIRGYTGGLGVAIASLANPILNTEVSAVEKPTMKTSKMPFIGGLFQPVEGRGTLDAAYERILEVQQVQGTYKSLRESGKEKEAAAFLDQYRNKLANVSLSGEVRQQLGELATARRQVIASNRTAAEKDELLEKIDDRQYRLAQRFLSVTGETRPQ